MYDIIIIGAGPAGLTAAIYARRASKKTLVLEATTYGGQIINTLDIDNYPLEPHISGIDFAKKLYNQVIDAGAEIEFEKAIEIVDNGAEKIVKTEDDEYRAKAVIIATGSENRKLGLENEDELIGRGISYCATCDGAFYKGKTVAVVGGGNTALEDALYLADIAEKVYLIHRRDEFRGEAKTAAALKTKSNVEFVYNSNVTKLIADKKLEQIEVKRSDGSEKTFDVDGLFVAVGRIPSNKEFAKLVKTDESGYIEAGEDCKTNVEGVFVAGDNRKKDVRQLVTAASDGAAAATAAIRYINGGYYATI
jgi:thioredoxin reductase (NADPH)